MTVLQDLIWNLGMHNTYMGYRQLIVAVDIAQMDPECLTHVTTLLYPAVAKATNTSLYSVERNLRTIINVCWERGNQDRLNEIAGYRLLNKPTVKEMIGILVNYLNQRE